jgi:hypothetical protein
LLARDYSSHDDKWSLFVSCLSFLLLKYEIYLQALSKLAITIQEQSQHQTKAGRFLPIDMASLAVGQITSVCSAVGNGLIYMGILLVPLFLVACIIHQTMQQWPWYRRGYMPMTAAAHNNHNNIGSSSDKNDSFADRQ